MGLSIMQDGSERIRYDNAAIPIYVKRGDLISFQNMSALCHWHEEVELLMPLKGYLRYNINGVTVTVKQGSAVFVNARQMHYGFSGDGSDCQYLCVTFRPQLLCANEEIQNRYILPLLTSPALPYMVLRREDGQGELLDILMELDRIWQEGIEGCELQAIGGFYRLWQGLYTLASGRIGEAISTDSNVLIQKRMLDFIRTHYQEHIDVNAIAAAGGVCRTKCWQIFKKYLMQTPNEYLNSFRMEKGMELLRSTRMTVTEIADACGYSSACYFAELFTRMKGCTPTQYRRG